jgi:hypothetical protein
MFSAETWLRRAIPLALILAFAFTVLLLVHLGMLWGHFKQADEAKSWYDTLDVIVHVTAVIVGAAWVYQSFVIFRENAWNIQLSQSYSVITLDEGNLLLCVDICAKNIGKVSVSLDCNDSEGLVISFGRVPRKMAAAQVLDVPVVKGESVKGKGESDKEKITSLLTDDVGYDDIKDRGPDPWGWKWINVLRNYSNYYLLEPGVEYHEREYVAVPAGSLILSRVYLVAEDGRSIRDIMLMDVSTKPVTEGPPRPSPIQGGEPAAVAVAGV